MASSNWDSLFLRNDCGIQQKTGRAIFDYLLNWLSVIGKQVSWSEPCACWCSLSWLAFCFMMITQLLRGILNSDVMEFPCFWFWLHSDGSKHWLVIRVVVATNLIAVVLCRKFFKTFNATPDHISCLLDRPCCGSRIFIGKNIFFKFLLMINELLDFAMMHFCSWSKDLSLQNVSVGSSRWELFTLEKSNLGVELCDGNHDCFYAIMRTSNFDFLV